MSEVQVKGIAFLFAGNLSVRQGMLHGIAEQHPEIREPIEQASSLAGTDLWKLIEEGPEETLRQDPIATLTTIAAGVGLYKVLESIGVAPVALAGYGPGYCAATVAAGVLPLETALAMAAEEQRIGWELLGERSFSLVEVKGLEAEKIEDLLSDLIRKERVSIAAQDGPRRMTLAGEEKAIQDALHRLEATVGSVEQLPRSLPRHTPALLGVPERLNGAFGRLRAEDPQTPLYSHFDGSIVLRGWQAKELLIKQMIVPLRWDQCIRGLIRNGIDTFIEVGPGGRVSEIVQEIEPGARQFVTDGPESLAGIKKFFSTWGF